MHVILGKRCISCGKCQDNCPEKNTIREGNDYFYIEVSTCLNCGQCKSVCPVEAIVEADSEFIIDEEISPKYYEKKTVFFKKAGKKNTLKVLELAKERALELNIRDVVLPTTTGKSALDAIEYFGNDFNVVVIPCMYGRFKPGENTLNPQYEKKLREIGVPLIFAPYFFSGVDRAIFRKWGGMSSTLIVRQTLKLFGEGVKVCVEVSIVGADAGVIPIDREVIALGGTIRGFDTAMVIHPTHSLSFFDIGLREIICMPRQRIPWQSM